jgi:hypothetical protein
MDVPGVGILLAIDAEYREKARAGSLPLIAPRRLNPEGKAWLPVLHKRYAPWHFTALFPIPSAPISCTACTTGW